MSMVGSEPHQVRVNHSGGNVSTLKQGAEGENQTSSGLQISHANETIAMNELGSLEDQFLSSLVRWRDGALMLPSSVVWT